MSAASGQAERGVSTATLTAGSSADKRDVRVIAFYLPQFHPIPENDRWWGEGFTEWTNVRRARPNFVGHYQPHVPGELGYYDLRDADVGERQAALARRYGIHGFCYYYYWFNGKRLLERPLDKMLSSGRPDFPFCVCWANENWTRRWDGLDNEILIAQHYSHDDSRAFIRSLFPLFRDPRYIRVDGAPLLVIYKGPLISELAATLAMWRNECRAAGLGEIHLVAATTSPLKNLRSQGFDAAVEFPPHGHMTEPVIKSMTVTNPRFEGAIFNLHNYVAQLLTTPLEFPLYRTLMPGWDNTPRRQDHGSIFVGSSPEIFQYWLEQTVRQTRLRHPPGERLIFINAWNEWGEGCHLEPDRRFGRGFLEAVEAALATPATQSPPRPNVTEVLASAATLNAGASRRQTRLSGTAPTPTCAPQLSVVMTVHNHERFVEQALESVVAQTFGNLEIVVVDGGSTDNTASIIDTYAARCASHPITVVHRENGGAYAAINHGLALARGDVVALIGGDQLFAPTRLAKMLAAMDKHDAGFVFSDIRFIGDDRLELDDEDFYVDRLRNQIARCRSTSNPLLGLLQSNAAVSSGNFCFRRGLLGDIGGFAAFRVCDAWDFILAASYVTSIRFVPELLFEYRLHREDSSRGLRLLAHAESDQVQARFFERVETHPILSDAASRTSFLRTVRRCGLAGLLPASLRNASLQWEGSRLARRTAGWHIGSQPGTGASTDGLSGRERSDEGNAMNSPYVWQSHLGDDIAFDAAYSEVSRPDILSFITEPPGTVLDIGCAGGTTGRLLKKKFPGTRVIGIEPNEDAATRARRHLDLVVSTAVEEVDPARDLDGADIDLVLLMDVLEHLADPWRALVDLRELIGTETRVLASIPNVRNLATLHDLAGGRWRYRVDGVLDVTHLRFFTLAEMRAMFSETGYRIVAVDPLTRPDTMTGVVCSHRPGVIETANLSVRYQSVDELEEYYAIQYVIDARKAD